MSKEVVLLFAGQGAQRVGMGRDLADSDEVARALFERADALLGFGLSKVMFEGPLEELTRTSRCQPALYVHGLAVLEVLRERVPSLSIVAAAGLSLGEFTAHAAAGTFDFETGLKLVFQRGTSMEEACTQTKGSMAAMIGGEENAVLELAAECGVDVANFNAPGQIVLSGGIEGIKAAVAGAKAKGFGGLWNSLWPAPTTAASWRVPRTNWPRCWSGPPSRFPRSRSCPTSKPWPAESADEIRESLTRQVTGSVRWTESMEYLLGQGRELFLELGPGGVLGGLMGRIRKGARILSIEDQASLDVALSELAETRS